MNEKKVIELDAIFNKATTTVDGGWNITLSVSQDEADKITELANYRDYNLKVVIVPYED